MLNNYFVKHNGAVITFSALKKYKVTAICFLFFLVGAILFCLQSPLSPAGNGMPGADSGVFSYIGKAMTQGQVMYRDMFDHKGPLLYFLQFIGYSMAGLRGIWLIECFTLFVAMALCYSTAEKYIRQLGLNIKWHHAVAVIATIAAFVPLVYYFERGNLAEEYALPFLFGGLYLFSECFFNDCRLAKGKIILAGSLFGAVFLLRPNMVAIWGMAVGVLIQLLVSRRYRDIIHYAVWFVLGALLMFLPFAFYLLVNGAWNDFIYQYFLFNFKYTSYRQVQTSPILSQIHEIWQMLLLNKIQWIYAAAAVTVLVGRRSFKKGFLSYCIMYTAVFLLTLVFLKINGGNAPHYYMVIIPGLILPITLVAAYIYHYLSSAVFGSDGKNWGTIFATALLFIAISVFHYPDFLQYRVNVKTATSPPRNAKEINEVSEYINRNTVENDTIALYDVRRVYHHTTPRMSCTKYIFQFPIFDINPSLADEYFADIEQHNPRIILVSSARLLEDTRVQRFYEQYELTQIIENIAIFEPR